MDRPALLTTRSTPPNARTARWKASTIWAFVGDVGDDADGRVRATELASDGFGAGRVDVGDDDARALGGQSMGDGLADAGTGAGHEGDPSGERLRLRHPGELGFLERPVLDPELLGLGDRCVGRDRFGATHDVDGVDVELAGDAGGLLVRPEREHPDARHQHDRRVRAAHRRAVRGGVSLVVGAVVVPVGGVEFAQPRRRRPRAAAVGGRSSTIGRTLVRRKWSGQDVPSAASRGCSARPRKSRTTSLSVKCPTCGRSVEASPRISGSRAAARACRSGVASGSYPGMAGPNGSALPVLRR